VGAAGAETIVASVVIGFAEVTAPDALGAVAVEFAGGAGGCGEVEFPGVAGGFGDDAEPAIVISEQLRYTCAVWNEFHLKLNSVCSLTKSGILTFFVTEYPPAMLV
jgi:hypothetical protein